MVMSGQLVYHTMRGSSSRELSHAQQVQRDAVHVGVDLTRCGMAACEHGQDDSHADLMGSTTVGGGGRGGGAGGQEYCKTGTSHIAA
jgi:hypothetical protein